MEEENKLIFSELPKEYTAEYLREGSAGICYKLGEDKVFKWFKECYLEDDTKRRESEEDLLRQTNIESMFIHFPRKLIYINDKLVGYVSNHVDGRKYYKLSEDTNMKLLACSLDNLEKEIRDISKEYSLVMFDLHSGNVIVDNNSSVNVIDTDEYIFDYYVDTYESYRYNIKVLANTTLYTLFKNIDIKDDNINKYYLQAILDGKCKPSYVLHEVIGLMEKEMKSEVTTFNEFTQGLKLIKK